MPTLLKQTPFPFTQRAEFAPRGTSQPRNSFALPSVGIAFLQTPEMEIAGNGNGDRGGEGERATDSPISVTVSVPRESVGVHEGENA